jgi:hypothetical protein
MFAVRAEVKQPAMRPARTHRLPVAGFGGEIILAFFIASLFDIHLCWGMEANTQTFHPCRHPKKK